jgi:hypothetical protein
MLSALTPLDPISGREPLNAAKQKSDDWLDYAQDLHPVRSHQPFDHEVRSFPRFARGVGIANRSADHKLWIELFSQFVLISPVVFELHALYVEVFSRRFTKRCGVPAYSTVRSRSSIIRICRTAAA